MATVEEKFVHYLQKVEKTEKEIERLQGELAALSNPEQLSTASEELEKFRSENQKLKFQLNHLKRYLAEEQKRVRDCALDVRGVIEDIFALAIHDAFPEIANPSILVVPSAKFADYQCNSSMSIAQQLGSIQGTKVNPREIAQTIINNLPKTSFFEKIEIAGPGFINISLAKEFVAKELKFLLTKGVKPPHVEKKKVLIDYSSPNIAKEMHVGHLRSTIIGDSLGNLMEWVGHDVVRVNHLGDWGTQFGMLIAHLIEKYPNLLEERPPIEDLHAFYKESKQRFDTDEEFKRKAYDCVVKLQSKDPFHYQAWKIIYDISMEVNNALYRRLDISPKLQERGESFYQERMEKVVKELAAMGATKVENGCTVMFVPGFEVPLMVTKSDGGFTYDTSDIACIKQRLFEENADWIIYVVDAGQSTHLQSIYAAADKLGWVDKAKHRIDHVAFGVVLGEDKKKYKSRSGDTVKLRDLLDEGIKRVEARMKETGRDQELTAEEVQKVKESVAYGCIKYADLSHNRTHDYVFSFDKMLDDRGNTAAYLLYANTRIRSIARSANVSPEELAEAAKTTLVDLDHPAEWKLAKCILRFTEVVTKVLDDLLLHTLCDYLYELTTTFTEFYDKCYCIEKDRTTGQIVRVNMSRLLMCEATALVIATCFNILGIKPLDKM
ncbi:unnamed protein product [Candidula unifasciata]|uniref:arginine--tRNA ligase n=1 Tax=Candidula unifasciata TaxID=100452 RepID=A0A8S3ZZY7_9EUPU|nr:unnamed protein product [Candidula unifasciata]